MTPDPTDNRATAERIAREVFDERHGGPPNGYFADTLTKCVLAGMAHRDRTAEREAARKAIDWMAVQPLSLNPMEWATRRDRYLAAEFDAGERVTLSDGSVVTRSGYIIRREHADEKGADGTNIASWELLIRRTDTGADFDAVKRLAEQRGAER